MIDADRQAFAELMDELGLVYERQVSAGLLRVYWGDLADLSLAVVQASVRAHRQDTARGRYFPRPADVRAKAGGGLAGHPETDLAWAVAVQSFDEAASVVWTREIEQARNAALSVWQLGDRVGARMAFRAAYERVLSVAGPCVWHVSVGHDADRRRLAVQQAQSAGLLSQRQAQALLPAPTEVDAEVAGVVGLVSGKLVSGKVVALPQKAGRERAHVRLFRKAVDAGIKLAACGGAGADEMAREADSSVIEGRQAGGEA